MHRLATLAEEKGFAATQLELGAVQGAASGAYPTTAATGRLEGWLAEARDRLWTPLSARDFSFHQHTPPLRSIDYGRLSPSQSIRMPLAVIFADLDRYTAYIDRCMAEGGLDEAVRLLHVLRSELNAVVQNDFGGRKVRFIGDCILAILAEGSAQEIDLPGTITRAALCAGALRSSFDLCGDIMPETRKLGLAIGIETGPTPVSRIGIRGERAVRVVSSLAVRGSEACQCDCSGNQTRLGPNAYANANAAVRSLFWRNGTADGLTYDDVAVATDGPRVAASVAGTPAARLAPAVVTGAAAAAIASPARGYIGD